MFVAYSCKKQNNGTRWRVVIYKNKKHSFFILKFSKLFGFVDIFYDEIDKKYHKLLRYFCDKNILDYIAPENKIKKNKKTIILCE